MEQATKETKMSRFKSLLFGEKSVVATFLLIVLIVAGILSAYFGCYRISKKKGLDQFEDTANTVIDQIDTIFEQDGQVLRAMATMLSGSDGFLAGGGVDTAKLTSDLNELKPLQLAMNIRILLPSNDIILPSDELQIVSANQFDFNVEKQHGEHISRRIESVRQGMEGAQIIAHFMPIEKDGQTIAMLYGVTPLSSLPSLLRTNNLYNGNASVLIFDVKNEGQEAIMNTWHGALRDENGEVVLDENGYPKYNTDYKLTTLGDFGIHPSKGASRQDVYSDIVGLQRGYTQFKSDSQGWVYFYYAPAGGVVADQWEICITVPTSVAFGNVLSVQIVFSVVGFVFAAGLLAYFLWIRRVAKETIEKSVERAVLEEKLHKAEAAERAKTTFLSNMSHDIRTPMNAILGFTALAETNIDNKERVQDYLKKILSSGNHLLSLINDILDMSRIESGKLNIEEKPCSISDIFHDMRNIIQTQMKGKQLNFYMDTLDVVDEGIFCDKLHLNQVLLNLLSNAIKFTPAGGSISLTVAQKGGAPTGYGSYEIRVKDTGIGMSKEFAEHIFEPFERERTSTVSGIQGTGLGMAITKNIVDTMGGTIRVETEKGKGSEFIIDLQFRLQSEHRAVDVIRELEGLRALVVDDNFETCDSVSKMLIRIGMRSEWTMYGKEAVLRAQQAIDVGNPFSAYIIDWVMPDLSGFEIVRQIRKVVGDDIPIIIITAYDVTSVMEEAKDLGVTAYCNKPIFLSELRDTLVSAVTKDGGPKEEKADFEEGAFKGRRVLLVEDNELNREIAEELLLESGFEVETAEDGSVAVEKVKEAEAGYFDIVLMDVQMPVMDGYAATTAIRSLEDKERASVPIVAMTANAFDEDRRQAAACGMNAHIAKPINIPQLFEVLRTLLPKD